MKKLEINNGWLVLPDGKKVNFTTQLHHTLPTGPVDICFINQQVSQNILHDLKLARKIAKQIVITSKNIENLLGISNVTDVTLNINSKISYECSQDIGDVLASLATIKHYGVAELILVNKKLWAREVWTKDKVKLLQPLLEQQSYIEKVSYSETSMETAINLDLWREYPTPGNIIDQCARCFNIPTPLIDPWITCGNKLEIAEVVIARGPRYHSDDRLWIDVMNKCKDKVFVGLKQEWLDFKNQFGKIGWYETKDFLQLAQVIRGSKLFIGSQSAPHCLAIGMGHNTITEVYKKKPFIIERDNVLHCKDYIDFKDLVICLTSPNKKI